MKKPMSRLLASVLAAIMLINCMIVTALAADARVISMNYQPHPLYPGMNGNAVVEVDYGDSTGRGICVEPAKDGPAVGSTLSLSEADTTMTRYAYMASQTSDIYRTWCIHHAAANHLGLGNGSRDSGITAVYGVYGSESDAWSDSNRLGTLTTDASGNTVTLELRAGTYWRRELTAPKGYALDTGVYSFSVTAGNTTTLSVSDNPQSDPVGVLLKKIDATSGDGEMR